MPELQRELFVHDDAFGGDYGFIQLGEQRFEGRISGRGNQDSAWAVAAWVFAFLEHRFAEIEDLISRVLVPLSGVDRYLGLESEEAVRLIIHGMRATKLPQFTIHDHGYSTVYFEAVAGRGELCVEVLFDEGGELLTMRR